MADRMILYTGERAQHPWPDNVFVQGGAVGVVMRPEGNYRTAFVEAFPNNPATFLRGEGKTIAVAETACWARYQRMLTCPAHPVHGPFDARQYRNGAGFCTACGTWFSKVLPELPKEPGEEKSLAERVFSGDLDALVEVVATVANAESLPTRSEADTCEDLGVADV